MTDKRKTNAFLEWDLDSGASGKSIYVSAL